MSTLASVCIYDVYSNLPSAGIPGRMFYVSTGTNAGKVYRDNGSTWDQVATGGGGSSPLTTKGDLYGFDTADARIPIGTNGQVLTADSGQALGLKWAAAGGGGLVLLEEHTASGSAALNFTASISSTYDEYVIEILNCVPSSSGQNLVMQMSTNGGSSYDTGSNYFWDGLSWRTSAAVGVGGGTDTSIGLSTANGLSVDTSSAYGVCFTLRMYNPFQSTCYTQVRGSGLCPYPGVIRVMIELGGQYSVLAAVNAFRFQFTSGNIASGTIRCYGLAK